LHEGGQMPIEEKLLTEADLGILRFWKNEDLNIPVTLGEVHPATCFMIVDDGLRGRITHLTSVNSEEEEKMKLDILKRRYRRRARFLLMCDPERVYGKCPKSIMVVSDWGCYLRRAEEILSYNENLGRGLTRADNKLGQNIIKDIVTAYMEINRAR
jgi:hypothetical protein